tara:strand:+ start:16331 stop:17023 length:693 start_codon:yes stop_codon:yes gene_type:complete
VKILSVIPARSGSKSLKDKNIKLFNNLPLLSYSIKYSLKSKLITQTIVSTDSIKYAKISEKFGASVPFIRPKVLSKDNVQDFPVIKHALLNSEKYFSCIFDLVVLLRPTSPLRPSNLIENGVEKMIKNRNASSLRSITLSNEHPYRQWLLSSNKKYIHGYQSDVLESYNLPRQSLNQTYFQTGDIEIIRRETILRGSISGNKIMPLIIDRKEMLDIDDIDDWNNLLKRNN